MEITSVCPYCGTEMRDGAIPVYQRQLEWCPRSEKYGGIIEKDGVELSRMPGAFGVYANAGYCEQCKVVVVPVPDAGEVAGPLDKAIDRIDEFFEQRRASRAEKEKARKEQKRERRSKKRRENDPWEV